MRFVENWQMAWKWFSVQAQAGIVASGIMFAALPQDFKTPTISDGFALWCALLAGAGAYGRLVSQTPQVPPPAAPPP